MIGIGHGPCTFYHLQSTTSMICVASESPNPLCKCLGHPNVSKLQEMIRRLVKLKNFDCELGQLGKHVQVSFRSRVKSRVKSPFSVIHFAVGIQVVFLLLLIISILSLLLMNSLDELGYF